jgi:hypothetical protein
MTDSLLDILGRLPSAQPDAVRAARIRARCRLRLERRRPRAPVPGRKGRFLEPLVVGLGGVYLTEAIYQALRFYGII